MTMEEAIRAQVVAALQSPEGKAALRAAMVEALQTVNAEDDEKLVGAAAAALRLGLAKSTIYKLAAEVDLPSIKIKNSLRFKVKDLNAYREKHRRSPELVARLASEH